MAHREVNSLRLYYDIWTNRHRFVAAIPKISETALDKMSRRYSSDVPQAEGPPMEYERPAVESRESVEAELMQFLNNNRGGKGKGNGGMS